VTTRCNGKCIYCDIPLKSNGIDADIGDIQANLKDIKRSGIKFIDFTGGEPLLFNELGHALSTAKKLGFLTSITTNTFLYPKKATELQGLVNFLHFSLDSSNPAINDRLRGKNSFRSVMKAIEIALNLGEKPDLLFTVADENIESLHGMSELALKWQLMLIVNPVFSYFENPGLSQKHITVLRSFLGKPYVYINRAHLNFMEVGGNNINFPRCRSVSSTVVISPDNQLLLPCFHHTRTKVLITNNLYDILQSNLLANERMKEGTYTFCKGCTISCYLDPSFHFKFDRYFALSILSKAEYLFWKKIVRPIRKASFPL